MIFMSSLVAEPVEAIILNRNGARDCFPQISQMSVDMICFFLSFLLCALCASLIELCVKSSRLFPADITDKRRFLLTDDTDVHR